MLHIPRVGPRLASCLIRATFAENFYIPYRIYWTTEASAALKAKAECYEKQYQTVKYPPVSIFTRIGDNGGLRVAYEDFQQLLFTKKYLGKNYQLSGTDLSTDQIFFTYYALSYCASASQANPDVKAFHEDRVNVPLMNMPEFADAYNCADGKKMKPAQRCFFWK
ncbi:neprilysin-1-like [Haemaphysalis longicornis]